MELINIFFLFCALLLFFSVLASSISARIGMPLLLGFLAIGILVGEDGILGLQFSSFRLANIIAQLALALILLDGGLRTSISTFRVALKPASVMATWGVLVTVLCLGLFVTWLLGVCRFNGCRGGFFAVKKWRYQPKRASAIHIRD